MALTDSDKIRLIEGHCHSFWEGDIPDLDRQLGPGFVDTGGSWTSRDRSFTAPGLWIWRLLSPMNCPLALTRRPKPVTRLTSTAGPAGAISMKPPPDWRSDPDD